jgi:putative ABC transport system permease protein
MRSGHWVIEMRMTLKQMRYYARNYVAVTLAILLGIGFVACSIMAGQVLDATTRNSLAVQYRGTDIIATSNAGPIAEAEIEAIEITDGVATVETRSLVFTDVVAGTRSRYAQVSQFPETQSIRDGLRLESGRFPQGSNEVFLVDTVAAQLELDTGDTISMLPLTGQNAPGSALTMTVVGSGSGGSGLAQANNPDIYAWPEQVNSWAGEWDSGTLLITIDPAVDADQVVTAIEEVVSGDLIVRTYAQQVESVASDIGGDAQLLSYGLLGFALIALFVAGVVIMNTFSILIAQRSRNLALMRCVGATKRQIRRSVLIEAVVVGVIASVIGTAAGLMVTTGGANLINRIFPSANIATNVPIPATAIAWPLILGIAVTVIASLSPAQTATRVAPLAALRPQSALVQRIRIDMLRLGLCVVLIGGGGILIALGMMLSSDAASLPALLLGVFGGVVSFCGVLVGAVLIVPRVAAAFGTMATRVGGAPAYVAASNSTRNPKRATSTAVALLIAVALITMMSVGAESVKSTLGKEIDARSPVDLQIATEDVYSSAVTNGPAMPEGVMQIVQSQDNISESVLAARSLVTLEGQELDVLGIEPAAALRISRAPAQLEGLSDETVILAQSTAENLGVVNGDAITLAAEGTSATFTAIVSPEWAGSLVISRNAASALFPNQPANVVWLRFQDGIDVGEAVGSLQDSLDRFDRLYMDGGAEDKAANYEVLDTMLLVVTGLLGIAVIIALVGVGNTLSLSVIERTRESAILRAIGLTIGQFRVMLAIEGVILAMVGAAIGIVLGIAYGFAGAFTILSGSWGLSFAIPLERLVLIVLVAIAAGVASSVLPARRAVRVSPVEALAE